METQSRWNADRDSGVSVSMKWIRRKAYRPRSSQRRFCNWVILGKNRSRRHNDPVPRLHSYRWRDQHWNVLRTVKNMSEYRQPTAWEQQIFRRLTELAYPGREDVEKQ